ncbi:MAG TPA: hypothetical protein VK499_03675 [Propionibacteriaceae bacterium]|jgi:hypothetical protein|nr:hypothetical protein [Propionibacteriaceae bacterium]
MCGDPTTLATWGRSKYSWGQPGEPMLENLPHAGGIAPVGVPRLTCSRATSEVKNGLPPVRRCTSAMKVLAGLRADDLLYDGCGRVPVETGQWETAYSGCGGKRHRIVACRDQQHQSLSGDNTGQEFP